MEGDRLAFAQRCRYEGQGFLEALNALAPVSLPTPCRGDVHDALALGVVEPPVTPRCARSGAGADREPDAVGVPPIEALDVVGVGQQQGPFPPSLLEHVGALLRDDPGFDEVLGVVRAPVAKRQRHGGLRCCSWQGYALGKKVGPMGGAISSVGANCREMRG